MVKFALPLLALTAAVLVPAATMRTTFSFAQWVEDIIANPDTALTPDEAIAAAEAADAVGFAGGLDKRAVCNQDQSGWRLANVCRLPFLGCCALRTGPLLNGLICTGTGGCCLCRLPRQAWPARIQLLSRGRSV